MEKLPSFIQHLYKHHFLRYVFVGGTTFILDLGLLVLLHGKLGINLAIATSIAYWLSICYNFVLNRNWTFSVDENSKLHKHILSYALLLGFNYLFTVLFVTIVSHHIDYALAKIIAVPIQMSWTYFIYKYWVFV